MNSTKSPERLDFWTCFFLNSKVHTKTTYFNESISTNLTYLCKAPGTFLFGEGAGHVATTGICSLIFIIGLFGVVTNIFNVLLLRKAYVKESSFKDSLTFLAIVELHLCGFAIAFSSLALSILDNLDRSEAAFRWFFLTNIMQSVCRTGSIYVTILVTIERYAVVAFPVRSKIWFKPVPSRLALFGVVVFSLLVNMPWMFKSAVDSNDDYFSPNVTDPRDLEGFPYVFRKTEFSSQLNKVLQEALLAINYVVPFPILLIFNGLLYKSIHTWNQGRIALSGRQKKEINAAKMFSIVVLILVICHAVSCIVFFTTRVQYVIYRELLLLQSLCVVFGAAMNFLVYYSFGQNFKREFFILLKRLCCKEVDLGNRKPSATSSFH